MKSRIVVGAVLWTVLITVSHIGLNVGFGAFVEDLRVMVGLQRPVLKVGFLPVT